MKLVITPGRCQLFVRAFFRVPLWHVKWQEMRLALECFEHGRNMMRIWLSFWVSFVSPSSPFLLWYINYSFQLSRIWHSSPFSRTPVSKPLTLIYTLWIPLLSPLARITRHLNLGVCFSALSLESPLILSGILSANNGDCWLIINPRRSWS